MRRPWMCALGASLCFCSLGFVKAGEPGYFLSGHQKLDLLRYGCIQDDEGTWYDVWICPGYVPPARYARTHLKTSGANFHEYLEANKYRALKKGSKACLEWALDECGLGFTVKGIPRAWTRHFTVAHERTRRRVFGWWMAYPWAFMESAVESAFRAAVGSVGTAGGMASGVAVVPAYHALDSAVVGAWNLSVNTLLVPAAGVGWNTVVGPPLALLGQKPSPSRVDGFWVTIADPDHAPRSPALSEEDIRLLGQWGLLLLKETEPFVRKQEALDNHAAEHMTKLRQAQEALRAETRRQQAELRDEERAHIQRTAATNELASALFSRDPAPAYGRTCEAEVRRYLAGLNIPGTDIERVLGLLRQYSSPRSVSPSPVREKTDPLRRGVDVITDSAEDMLQ